jgi:hypothetical protein
MKQKLHVSMRHRLSFEGAPTAKLELRTCIIQKECSQPLEADSNTISKVLSP